MKTFIGNHMRNPEARKRRLEIRTYLRVERAQRIPAHRLWSVREVVYAPIAEREV